MPEEEEQQVVSATSNVLWADLAIELKAARELSGLTIKAWLSAAGLTYSEGHISNIEHGRSKPRRELVTAYESSLRPHERDLRLTRLWDQAQATEDAERQAERAAAARQKGLSSDSRTGVVPR